jgi:hypothetical protein
MNTVIKPNDIINQILAVAAELTPVAELCWCGEPWAEMLTERTAEAAYNAVAACDRANSTALHRAATAVRLSLGWGRTCLQLHYDLQEVQDARAALEPLLAELREVPA